MTVFADRAEAGRELADAVSRRLGDAAPGERRLVLALPRGGVPVAVPVAAALDAPMDVLVVRKLGAPGHEELAMGAIATGDVEFLNERLVRQLGVDRATIARIVGRERAELERRERAFRGGRRPPDLAGATLVVVDDGVATGATMKAALDAVRAAGATRVVVAIPLAPSDTLAELRERADEVICLATPTPFWAVGQGYRHFPQVSDEEVRTLLGTRGAPPAAATGRGTE
jgi:predicted phosphoribosyltransferase